MASKIFYSELRLWRLKSTLHGGPARPPVPEEYRPSWPLRSAGHGLFLTEGVKGIGRETFLERLRDTHHNPVYRDLEWFVRQHPDIWISTVSKFLARKLWRQGATRCHAIHNGIDMETFTFQPRGGEGLLFLGRMEEKKGPDLAVQVARALDRPLILAGPMVDEGFFDRAIRPFLNGQIRYVGVVNHRQKTELFGQAACVLMPSRWEEPFGLVAIEAMACGTPVVAPASVALPDNKYTREPTRRF